MFDSEAIHNILLVSIQFIILNSNPLNSNLMYSYYFCILVEIFKNLFIVLYIPVLNYFYFKCGIFTTITKVIREVTGVLVPLVI